MGVVMATVSDKLQHAGEEVAGEELLERARKLRPLVEQQAAETERLTHISEDLHRRFDEAGFYRMLIPKRFGGLETDLPTYVKVWMEIARGDASAAWCGCLAANHSLQLASWWPERAQEEVFGSRGDFKAASVAAPLSGFARRVDGGWELNGKVSYCSGIPYATHYIGQALPEPAEKGGSPGPPLLFVAPRSAFTVLDDWGELTGLIGSGSNSIVFDKAFVPSHWVLENTHMADVECSGGTIGSRLHGDPMYATRGIGFFTMTVGAIMIGAAMGALDEFERILKARKTIRALSGRGPKTRTISVGSAWRSRNSRSRRLRWSRLPGCRWNTAGPQLRRADLIPPATINWSARLRAMLTQTPGKPSRPGSSDTRDRARANAARR